MPARILKRHDTKVTPRVRLLDEDGNAIVLTGCVVTYTMIDLSAGTLKINRGVATLEDQFTNTGQVFYQFLQEDVDTAGIYEEQWEVIYTNGLKETFPVGVRQQVVIEDDLDNV